MSNRSLQTIYFLALILAAVNLFSQATAQTTDFLRERHLKAVTSGNSDWIHWGDRKSVFSNWTNHSNRLIPVYTFGIQLDSTAGQHSPYRDAKRLKEIYGRLPDETLNSQAEYFDQTDIYHLQRQALEAGKKNIILMVFDGMDWQTTQAAAIYKNQRIDYTKGRGTGLAFLDYANAPTDFGFFVTSPHSGGCQFNVDTQHVAEPSGRNRRGGYSAPLGGSFPWSVPGDPSYLLGKRKNLPHVVTDSAASATSMTSGKKTYNGAINTGPTGDRFETIAHRMQKQGFAIGVVTNVPISHATPGCAYAHNVTRNDYQDITRDLLGQNSVCHHEQPLDGVDVLIGCGWGEKKSDDRTKQGRNFEPGNKFLPNSVLETADAETGGRYVIAQRTPGKNGTRLLIDAARKAAEENKRLLGFFGVSEGHLPYQTADGNYNPTRGIKAGERYEKSDIEENPTLAEMTTAALTVLETNDPGFWLMVEAGDVDWANHNNNIDDSIGAVLSGESAFTTITNWVEKNSNWDETALIVTADHGHMLVIENPDGLRRSAEPNSDPDSTPSKKKKN